MLLDIRRGVEPRDVRTRKQVLHRIDCVVAAHGEPFCLVLRQGVGDTDGRAGGRAADVAGGVAVGGGIGEAAVEELGGGDEGDCCVVGVRAVAGDDYGCCFVESVFVRSFGASDGRVRGDGSNIPWLSCATVANETRPERIFIFASRNQVDLTDRECVWNTIRKVEALERFVAPRKKWSGLDIFGDRSGCARG